MEKEKKILLNFTSYILLGLLICLVGLSNVFASTYYTNYNYYQRYYNNNGSSVSSVSTTWNESLQSYVSGNIPTVANSYGAGLSISSPIPIVSNHTYTISIFFEEINNIALSLKSNIAISTSLDGAAYNYANSDFWADTFQSKVNNNSVIQFVFKAEGPANFIFIPWTTTTNLNQSYVLTQINMEDLGSEGVSQEDINNSLNLQTNTINSSIQNSTDTITGEINDMENALKDQLGNKCNNLFQHHLNSVISHRGVTFTPVFNNNLFDYYLVSGRTTSGQSYAFLGNFNIPANSSITIPKNNGLSLQLWDETNNKLLTFVTDTYYFSTSQNNIGFYIYVEPNFNGNSTKFWVQVNEGSSSSYCPFGSYSSKIDETNDKLDETNNQLGDLNNNITDDSVPDIDGLGDSAGWLPPGPLDSVLNLPLSLFNSLTTNLNKSCSAISIPLPYVKKNLTIPCINSLYEKIGVSTFITWLGVVVSGFMLYTYLLKLYKWIEDRISLNETHSVDNWGGL